MSFTPYIFDQRSQSKSPICNPIAPPEHSTIELVFDGVQPGSVVSYFNGKKQLLEQRAPWRIAGDGGELKWKAGANTLQFQAYSKAGGKGALLMNKTITVNVAAPAPLPEVITVFRKGLVGWLSYPVDKVVAVLDATQCPARDYRVWFDPDIRKVPDAGQFKKFSDAGVKLTVCLAWKNPYPMVDIANWTEKAWNAIGKYVETWEIGNEPNLKNYYSGSTDDYIQLLSASSSVLRARGSRVIGGSVSENLQYLQWLVDKGLLNLCDAVGFHPYGANAIELEDRLAKAKAIIGNKPLEPTELNIHAHDARKWESNAAAMFAATKKYCARAHYYRITVSGQYAGKQAVCDTSYKPNDPFYSAFKAIK